MLLRAFTPSLRSLAASVAIAGALIAGPPSASAIVVLAAVPTNAPGPVDQPDAPAANTIEPPVVTDNEFLPEDRDISECVSAVPKPGCGSEARGGWRQGLVAIALVAGLCVIGWRIAAGVRRAAVPGTPDATAAPTDRGADHGG